VSRRHRSRTHNAFDKATQQETTDVNTEHSLRRRRIWSLAQCSLQESSRPSHSLDREYRLAIGVYGTTHKNAVAVRTDWDAARESA
jgi:hypothetical protein